MQRHKWRESKSEPDKYAKQGTEKRKIDRKKQTLK